MQKWKIVQAPGEVEINLGCLLTTVEASRLLEYGLTGNLAQNAPTLRRGHPAGGELGDRSTGDVRAPWQGPQPALVSYPRGYPFSATRGDTSADATHGRADW